MKVAFFSPLPPAKSGIADYSAALLEELKQYADVTAFDTRPARFDPAKFDTTVYQIGNNAYHDFCYETALQYPGVVVLHEANLHHLIADLTISRGDWNAYMREVEFDGGPDALRFAERVRRLEIGPDYEGVPMLRRLLCRSKAAIVHSECVRGELRSAGFERPIARIPHGAWTARADRNAYRLKLGLDESTPLIGIFGFLKPYKRIAESLRAFRRLLRLEPTAKLILVGEPHPELRLPGLLQTLDLNASVRVLGFTPIEDFTCYMAACDIVLNLRFPTVGENSGSLMRALGLGKAVLVSDVGSFCEYPDDVCLKVPVDAAEEDTLFEYLNLLVSRPIAREELGQRAREWVQSECSWPHVAQRYAEFLRSVVTGEPFIEEERHSPPPEVVQPPTQVDPTYVSSWAADEGGKTYVDTHLTRLTKTLAITPPGTSGDRILEMGAYLQITPALKTKLGYGEVRGCYYGPAGRTDHRRVTSLDGETFECDLDLFNAEKDRFPYDDAFFSTVLCGELIEHLFEDPMHLMSEINRILKPGGHVVLTTPNICSLRAVAAILQGYHPGFYQSYLKPSEPGIEVDARHNREYTPQEIEILLTDAGFEKILLETGPFRDEPKPEHAWVLNLLDRYFLPKNLRGDGIYAVGRKTGPVRPALPRLALLVSTEYRNVQTHTDGLRLSIRFGIRPQSEAFVGWQLFDPDTNQFIREGEWLPLAQDMALNLDFPPEPGDYRIYISTLSEKEGWAYNRGDRFLIVDAAVADERVGVRNTEITTKSALRWRAIRNALPKAFQYPFFTIARNRRLIQSMARRDILARYRGSFGDVLWTILNPLLLMATYFFVFGVVLRARFGNDNSPTGFALYFLAGMLPWLAFSEPVGRSSYVILEHRNFVKKLIFPLETLPVNLVVSGLVTELFALGVFTLALILLRGSIPVTVLWLPAVLIPQLLFTLGVCWFLAALGAFFRDLGQIMGFVLTLWFFITPICYPERTDLPGLVLAILRKNPIYVLVREYRAIFLEHSPPAAGPLIKLWVLALAVFLLGHACFYKVRRTFADVV